MKPPDDKVKAKPGGATTSAHSADDPDYRYPERRVLQVVLYQTQAAKPKNDAIVDMVRTAQSLLVAHNLEMRVYPDLPRFEHLGPYIVDWSTGVAKTDREQV